MRRRDLIRTATLVVAFTMAIGMVGCGKKNNEDKAEVTVTQEETKSADVAKDTVSTSVKEDGKVVISATDATGKTVEYTVAADEVEKVTTALTEGDTTYVFNESGEVVSTEQGNSSGETSNEPAEEPQTEAPQVQPTETEQTQAPAPSGPDLSWYGTANPGDKTGCYDGFEYDESLVYSRIMNMQNYYPTGTSWTGSNQYLNFRVYPTPHGGGCNGFAAMVQDAAFGNRACRTHSDINSVRVGDVIWYSGNGENHVVIVIGFGEEERWVPVEIEGKGTFIQQKAVPVIYYADGNSNSQVHWDNSRTVQGFTEYESLTIYTRY